MVPNRAQNAPKRCLRYPNGGQKGHVKGFFNSPEPLYETDGKKLAAMAIVGNASVCRYFLYAAKLHNFSAVSMVPHAEQ